MTNQLTTLYFGYGMNTNVEQMARRCPNAISLGKKTLIGYKFIFRGVADIIHTGNKNDKIEGVIWSITPECEKALDALEGYPTFYTKIYLPIETDATDDALSYLMIYKMVNQSKVARNPSRFYWDMLFEGYASHGLNHEQMYKGLPQHSHFNYKTRNKLSINQLINNN